MEEVVYKSLNIYFNTLSKLGYKSYDEVERLIVLLFINDLMASECSSFITEEELKIINSALYCLYGSTCLIPYPDLIANTHINCSGKP